jgi:hypothetical protein
MFDLYKQSIKILQIPASWMENETQICLKHRFLGKTLEAMSSSRTHLIPIYSGVINPTLITCYKDNLRPQGLSVAQFRLRIPGRRGNFPWRDWIYEQCPPCWSLVRVGQLSTLAWTAS